MQFICRLGGRRECARMHLSLWMATSYIRLRYWVYDGFFDSSRIAGKGDMTFCEWLCYTVTMLCGLWWLLFRQPAYSVLGFLDLMYHLGYVASAFLVWVGRIGLDAYVRGSIEERCTMLQRVSCVWTFLLLNQLLLNAASSATIMYGMMLYLTFRVYRRVCSKSDDDANAHHENV